MIVQTSPAFKQLFSNLKLEIPYSGYVVTDEKWRSLPLPTDVTRLYFVTEGSGVLLSDGDRLAMRPGYVYLAPCGAPCGYYGTDAVTKLFFHIKLTDKDGRDVFSGCRRLLELECAKERIAELTALYFDESTVSQLRLRGEILSTVCSFLSDPRCHFEEMPPLTPPVTTALEYIRGALRADLTVAEVAEACFVSASLLGKAFRRQLHVGVAQYIENQLMLAARQLLLDSNALVGEISERLGYCDQFYFSRRFRNAFGQSPREYRKNRSYT